MATTERRPTTHSAATADFPPIGSYAFLTDCHTGALVAQDGCVEWLCLPRFDSPSLCAAILDRGAGAFRFGPSDARIPLARRYVPGSNVVETTWMTDSGWLTVRDALVITSPEAERGERPHGAGQANSVLVRMAECVHGRVEVEALCAPVFDYASNPVAWRTAEGPGLVGCGAEGRDRIRIAANFGLAATDGTAQGGTTLSEGSRAYCWLSWGEELDGPADIEAATRALDSTVTFWRRWLESGRFPDHPWRVYLQRSALVLKGLTYAPTGAMSAAPTTSLPERIGGGRNWDYRYTWIRDTTFALWALHVLGFEREAREFLEFAVDLRGGKGPEGQIMFGIGGEVEMDERALDELDGYRGSRPVRIGNDAYKQRQNDVYGGLLDAIYVDAKARGGRLAERIWRTVRKQAELVTAAWRRPDQGIWEARGEPRHYVSSKLLSWVALDRAARLADRRGETELERRWHEEASAVRAEILEFGVGEDGVFRQHYDTDALDASTLLMPLLRFLPPGDARIHATVQAIERELTVNGLVLRYLPGETDDGLGGQPEGGFVACSFWLVAALSEIGERERARTLCERLLSFGSPLGLFAEEIEPGSGAQRGNFPQALSHLAVINAVAHVVADDRAGPRTEPSAVFSELRAAVEG